MNLKENIALLINAVNAEPGIDEAIKKREVDLIASLLESCQKYIRIVVKQAFMLQYYEGISERDVLEELVNIDQSRSRAHDSLIKQLAIINRMCEKYGLEPIYKGEDSRREKGDFALELINDYFRGRI